MFQDLAEEHNFIVINEYEFNNYIPKYIEQMEKIVSATYENTRGKLSSYFRSNNNPCFL